MQGRHGIDLAAPGGGWVLLRLLAGCATWVTGSESSPSLSSFDSKSHFTSTGFRFLSGPSGVEGPPGERLGGAILLKAFGRCECEYEGDAKSSTCAERLMRRVGLVVMCQVFRCNSV